MQKRKYIVAHCTTMFFLFCAFLFHCNRRHFKQQIIIQILVSCAKVCPHLQKCTSLFLPGLPSSCFLLPCHSSPNIPHIPHIPQCLQFLTKTTHGFFLGGFLFIILLMPGFGVGPSFQRFNSCLNVFSFVLHQILGHLVLFFVARKNARAVLPFLLLGRVVQPHETQQQVVV